MQEKCKVVRMQRLYAVMHRFGEGFAPFSVCTTSINCNRSCPAQAMTGKKFAFGCPLILLDTLMHFFSLDAHSGRYNGTMVDAL